jgi:hypothetical protein
MVSTALALDGLTLSISQEIHVKAPINITFAALLNQLGPDSTTSDGQPMSMKIEAWPGGRWFRDLGDGNGHFWGNVQAIKRPTLLEISGPLFMSYPVVSNVQYRLSEEYGGTLIKFQHSAFGLIQEEHRQNVTRGWTHMNQSAKARAEAPKQEK